MLPKAFGAARGGLNPQFFYYPSFFFYLVGGRVPGGLAGAVGVGGANPLAAASFVTDPAPYFVLGRLVSAAPGTASVYLLYRLGRRPSAARPASSRRCCSPWRRSTSPTRTWPSPTSRRPCCRCSPCSCCCRRRRAPARRRLVAGAVLAGLATSTKYNLGLLVLPATVAAVYACRGGGGAARGRRRPRRARCGCALLVAARLRADAARLRVGVAVHRARPGPLPARLPPPEPHHGPRLAGLGERRQRPLVQPHVNLTGALGVVLSACLAGLAWALWRRTAWTCCWPRTSVVYLLYVEHVEGARRPLPAAVVPLLILLGVRLCLDAARAAPARGGGSPCRP